MLGSLLLSLLDIRLEVDRYCLCIYSEHYEGSGELRILLCQPKPKKQGEKASSIVLAACGIYMKDILEAVPIDKYFELFKPGEGADGGFIRISMNYLRPDQVRNPEKLLQGGSSTKKYVI